MREFNMKWICVVFFLIVFGVAFPTPSLSQPQDSSNQSKQEELDLLRRQIEALEEQNRLLRGQIDDPTPSAELTRPDGTPANTSERSKSKSGPNSPKPVSSAVSKPKAELGSAPPTRAENIEFLERSGLDYKDLALMGFAMEALTCLYVAERNAYVMWWPQKIKQPPKIYDRIMEGREVWSLSIGTAKGRQIEKLMEKFDQLSRNEELIRTFELFGNQDIPPQLDAKFEEVMDSFIPTLKALERCVDTMPGSVREAHARYKEWKKLAKQSWKGNLDAYKEFDSIIVDIGLILESYAEEHGVALR
jgi:hypothetical protein